MAGVSGVIIRRILPGFEDVYEELFGDSESDLVFSGFSSSADDAEPERPQFDGQFRVHWEEGGVAPPLPVFQGEQFDNLI